MNRHARLSFATLSLLLIATPLAAQDIRLVEPPRTGGVYGSAPMLIVYSPGLLRCADGAVAPTELVMPYPRALAARFDKLPDTELRFRIDADGRARGINKAGEAYNWPASDDTAPALAASRFASGQTHMDCVIRYTGSAMPLAQATPELLAMAWAMPHSDKSQDRALWKALQAPGTSCSASPLRPVVARYPDYQLSARPGRPDYVVVAFDVDKAGRPVGPHVMASSGNSAIDKSLLGSVAGTRFEAGSPRTGCVVRLGRSPHVPMPAPIGDKEAFKPTEACKDEPTWATMPPLRFPPNFNRRAIEGWAVIRFDVAPWGAVGNVKVLASEPADDFGSAARTIVQMAQKPSSARGYSGCIQTVRFKIADQDEPDATGESGN